jgi:hypothetical protein
MPDKRCLKIAQGSELEITRHPAQPFSSTQPLKFLVCNKEMISIYI